MEMDIGHTAVLALHWQVNVIEPEGFFGELLSGPVASSGVVDRATRFHADACAAGVPVFFSRFMIPAGEGELIRNTPFMTAVGEAQDAFRPDAPGSALIAPAAELLANNSERVFAFDNQKLSALAGSALPEQLAETSIDTLLITGVATNLTVEQTARHGTDLGFTVHVISDCVTAADDTTHQASLTNLELTTAGSLLTTDALAALPT